MIVNPFINRKYIWILPTVLAVFLLFYFLFGTVIANDSWAFIEGSLAVSPLYPLVTRLCIRAFGQEVGLSVLVLFQEMLATYAVFSLTVCLADRFRLGFLQAMCVAAIPVLSYALRLFMVGKEALYCNTVLTEGFTYPLYFLFIKYAFFAFDAKRFRYLFVAIVVSLLLTLTRGQLINTFLIVAGLFIVILFKGEEGKSGRAVMMIKGVVTAAAYFSLILSVSCLFHYVTAGLFTPTTMGKEAVLGAVLYNSSSSDEALLTEETENKELFRITMIRSEADGLTYRSSPGGLIGSFKHYESSHDPIRGHLKEAILERYGETDDNMVHFTVAAFSDACLPVLLKANLGNYLRNCAVNALGGIVRSNSIMSKAGTILSAAVYLAGIAYLVVYSGKGLHLGERRLLGLVFLATAVNCLFCSFGVFELSRYVYYNFPCIYLSLLICFCSLFKKNGDTD